MAFQEIACIEWVLSLLKRWKEIFFFFFFFLEYGHAHLNNKPALHSYISLQWLIWPKLSLDLRLYFHMQWLIWQVRVTTYWARTIIYLYSSQSETASVAEDHVFWCQLRKVEKVMELVLSYFPNPVCLPSVITPTTWNECTWQAQWEKTSGF